MSHIFFYIIALIILTSLITFFIIRKKKSVKKSSQHYPENEQLYVGNLSYQVNGHQLKTLFSKYGEVQNVRLIKNTRTGRSKGFAFITYTNTKEAKKALAANGEDLKGRAIVVRMARPRDEITNRSFQS